MLGYIFIEKMDERVKLPRIVKYLLWIYMGVIGIMILTGLDMGSQPLLKILWGISLSVYTAAATYGIISLYEDLKKNGHGYVGRKIRRFFGL